jgi:hypothetical protein
MRSIIAAILVLITATLGGCVAYTPYPVYPTPIYVQSAPVYVQSRPVYYPPPRIYYQPSCRWVQRWDYRYGVYRNQRVCR